ncbi:MAG: hypothetical protein ABJG15_08885 [Hyphomonadaceae bacterium]
MLKHILCATILACGIPTASASPETAENWGVQASNIYQTTTDMLDSLNDRSFTGIPADFEDQMSRFASTASHLAVWTDDTQSAPDLGCIYRGMAEEAELQLIALEDANSASGVRAALKRIATMTDDAQSIAIASAHAGRTGEQVAPTGQCLTNSALIDHALGRGS